MSSLRIGVIGAGGYVGTHMALRAALRKEFELVAIGRSHHGLATLSRFAVPYRLGDAGDVASLAEAVKGCRVVVNLSKGDIGKIVSDTRNIAEACYLSRVDLLIHLSSAVVHGRANQPNLTEDSPPDFDPWDDYARAKAEAERWLLQSPEAQQVRSVILRPGLIWGPGSGWTVRPADAILKGSVVLVNGGQGTCNLIHIDNLIECILTVARCGEAARPGVFNVADPEEVTWRSYYEAVAAEIGVVKLQYADFNAADYRARWSEHPCVGKMKKKLPVALKQVLKAAIKKIRQKPRPRETLVCPDLSVTRELWWLMSTRQKLPTRKFAEAYGAEIRYLTFAETMKQSGAWLRFAGFRVDSLLD